jgi:hypothetical protein
MKCLDELLEWAPTPTQGQTFISVNVRSFQGATKHCGDHSPLELYLWGHLKPVVYSAAIQNVKTRQPRIFYAVKSFAIAPRPLESYSSRSSKVSIRTSIQVEESDVNCYFLNNNNSKVIKLKTCIVQIVRKILRSSGIYCWTWYFKQTQKPLISGRSFR